MSYVTKEVIEKFKDSFKSAKSERRVDPFTYAMLKDVWVDSFYSQMIDWIPHKLFSPFKYPPESMTEDGRWTRGRIMLDKKSLRRMRKSYGEDVERFWTDVLVFLCSTDYLHSVYDLVGNGLEKRVSKKDFNPKIVAQILRDETGYAIKPHPDSEQKRVTNQFYLTRDDRKSGGTSFYRARGGAYFKKIEEARFSQNTGYIFARTEKSFHGVEEYTGKEHRYSLIVRCY
jgi:hypothetical protein